MIITVFINDIHSYICSQNKRFLFGISHELHRTIHVADEAFYILKKITTTWRKTMFRWAIIFAVIALVASLFGFGGVAGMSKDFAVILLVVAVILAIVGFISRGKV